MNDKSERHNTASKAALKAMMEGAANGDGTLDHTGFLVIVESVLMGAYLMAIRTGGDNITLDVMVAGIRQRLAESRLGNIEAQGTA